MTTKPLKYLFTAHFDDDSTIVQTENDRSALEPETKSQFYDVLEREKQTKLVRFELIGEGHTYAVDLLDGHFEVDSVPFRMIEGVLPEYRLIFFRQHTHDFVAGTGEETRHDVCYRIGWQCTEDEKNYQRVMQID